jgi:DNA-binding transcriptional regulator GbsR (MarR family)
MKLKSFCTRKEMVKKLRRLPTEWKKTFTKYASDKGLTTRINRELKKLNSKTINDPIKKWTNEMHRVFSKAEVQKLRESFDKWDYMKLKSLCKTKRNGL